MARNEKQVKLKDGVTGKTITVSESFARMALRNPRYKVPLSVEDIKKDKPNITEEVVEGDIYEAMDAESFDKAMEAPKAEPKKAPRKRAPRKK